MQIFDSFRVKCVVLILGNDQPDTQFFLLQYVYYDPLHVSSIKCSKHVEDHNKRIVK